MNNRYSLLLRTALEKLPFFNYLARLWDYIIDPSINSGRNTKEQFRHSLLDIINALGLVAAFVGFLILLNPDNQYLNIITSFNPIYNTINYVIYGLCFSFVVALISTIVCATKLSNMGADSNDVFYYVFCHSLRFYAAIGFFLGILVVHAIGKLITEGTSLNEAFNNNLFLVFIVITLVYFPFRLYFNPLQRYLNFKAHKLIATLLVVFIAYIGITTNQMITPMLSKNIIDNQVLCKHFKNGGFYERSNEKAKKIGEELFCQ